MLMLLEGLLHVTDWCASVTLGMTPLHYAAYAGHTNMVAILLQGGANKSAQDRRGHTPIHVAAEEGHVKVRAGSHE